MGMRGWGLGLRPPARAPMAAFDPRCLRERRVRWVMWRDAPCSRGAGGVEGSGQQKPLLGPANGEATAQGAPAAAAVRTQ